MNTLKVSSGHYSDKGRKPVNQDFHGVFVPGEPELSSKGIAVALADGISSSQVSQEASKTAITSFFEDYYSTSEAWTVKTSVQRVLKAINSWLYAQTQRSEYRFNRDKGYVCTFSGLVIKASTAHIFHAGDARIYRLQQGALEALTEEHRVYIEGGKHYLKRALGADAQFDFDYLNVSLMPGDTFVLMTDGVYEFVSDKAIAEICGEHAGNLQLAAKKLTQHAYEKGSPDNLTAQIIRVDSLQQESYAERINSKPNLPFPPELQARMAFDGYTIVRQLYKSARSHVFLAVDDASQDRVVIKSPATEQREDPAYLERFLLEEWIARRINSAHVLKPSRQTRARHFTYVVTEYIEGQTLKQWMIDNPRPSLESVREIVEQIARGLQAFHRLEMLHQDLRPENIMIDEGGTVKIIDFGSTRVAGLSEQFVVLPELHILGTAQYTAPEYFLGDFGNALSDQFSLAVIAYQMLSGRLPYGAEVARAQSRAAQKRLKYRSVLDADREIPAWVDFALHKALHINPAKRYEVISEFLQDLRHPNQAFLDQTRPPLLERNPVAFWQGLCLIQTGIIIAFLYFYLSS